MFSSPVSLSLSLSLSPKIRDNARLDYVGESLIVFLRQTGLIKAAADEWTSRLVPVRRNRVFDYSSTPFFLAFLVFLPPFFLRSGGGRGEKRRAEPKRERAHRVMQSPGLVLSLSLSLFLCAFVLHYSTTSTEAKLFQHPLPLSHVSTFSNDLEYLACVLFFSFFLSFFKCFGKRTAYPSWNIARISACVLLLDSLLGSDAKFSQPNAMEIFFYSF